MLSKLSAVHCRVKVRGLTQELDPLDAALLPQGNPKHIADPSVPPLFHL